ncbi:hypothetical protein N7537_006191 [Penicillium hordei]|uniref:Uncharacterized protein n=1 Tax=Penicillium hordei TaxID=40994 RepID=A0AAD6H469_9EURO|nr:uncharacterized protein N7537_006191 [Penicillium hordei]KAJ5603235.1 hypothetical protein N7537_006191 [Penicillium hordei]
MDNYGSYTTINFIEFCNQHFIVLRVNRLDVELIYEIKQNENQIQRVKRHTQRSIDANSLSS